MHNLRQRAILFSRYPLSSVILYNGTTVLHYLAGGAGLIIGYAGWPGLIIGALYTVLSLVQMYLIMPLRVCPNCVYYSLTGSLCISGMNTVSRKIAHPGNVRNFGNRAKGLCSPNNFYMAALAVPIILIIPALFINFSILLLTVELLLLGLLLFRIFFIFPRIACSHCRAKNICPNARSMGLSDQQGDTLLNKEEL